MTDIGAVFERASGQLTATVASVGADAWQRPTSCEVPVRELVEHVLAGNDFDTFVWFRLGELVIHSWDLAVAVGLDTHLDPMSVESLLEMVAARGEQMRALGAFGPGPSGRLPPDAPAQHQLLDAFGRRAATS